MKQPWLGLAGLAVASALTPSAQADVVVRVPYVRVEVGPVVSVRTPLVSVAVPRGVPVVRPAGLPAVPVPVDPGAPPPVPEAPVPSSPVPSVVPTVRALSVSEFAASFRPASGPSRYEVVLMHPCTGCPVAVCFTLPGCPKRVKVTRTTLEFRYGLCKKPVVLRFCRDGSVQVR